MFLLRQVCRQPLITCFTTASFMPLRLSLLFVREASWNGHKRCLINGPFSLHNEVAPPVQPQQIRMALKLHTWLSSLAEKRPVKSWEIAAETKACWQQWRCGGTINVCKTFETSNQPPSRDQRASSALLPVVIRLSVLVHFLPSHTDQ